MKLKNTLILSAILVGIFACKDSASNQTNHSQKVEIPFKKEGVLQFINNDSVIQTIDIEIAETENEQRLGLMNRSQMAKNHGMLFIHNNNNTTGYWMRNTRIPLDIMYVAEDSTIINIVKNAEPYKEIGIPGPKSPKRFVVEINGGLSDQWNIIEGKTKISWIKL